MAVRSSSSRLPRSAIPTASASRADAGPAGTIPAQRLVSAHRSTERPEAPVRMVLEGKKRPVTGVLTDDSIAYAVARVAQEAGAEIVLTSCGRARSLTERVARKLPGGAPNVLE